MTHFLIVRPVNDTGKFSVGEQKLLWSRVGMLFYIVKYLRPDVAKAL